MKTKRTYKEKNWFWRTIDSIEGDKVVWIIVLLLIMFSILAIFSSTSLLREGSKDRIDFITEHTIVAAAGLFIIYVLYKVPWIGLFRALSKAGFAVSVLLLAMLLVCSSLRGYPILKYPFRERLRISEPHGSGLPSTGKAV